MEGLVHQKGHSWRSYVAAPLIIATCTLIALPFDRFAIGEANVLMIYLLGVLAVALVGERGPAALSAVLAILSFNFFFVEPRITLAVAEARYLITFGAMLTVGLVVSNLTERFRTQTEEAGQREQRTAALYALSREFASTRGLPSLLTVAVRHIHAVFDSRVVVLLLQADGQLVAWGECASQIEAVEPQQCYLPAADEQSLVHWVLANNQMAGLGTPNTSSASAIYLPLAGPQRHVGVLGVLPQNQQRLTTDQIHLLETFASQTALAIERARLAEQAAQATIAAETERLRAALLSSVSHDLRTPLAIISAALTSLAQGEEMERTAQREIAQSANEEVRRLNRLVSNLLEMTRLEAGAVRVHKEWQTLEEIVGAAVGWISEGQAESDMLPGEHPLTIALPPDLPLVPLDGVLIEQVLVNLLDNAIQHTPPSTALMLRAQRDDVGILVEVTDDGPGLAPGDEQRVFDKFYRGGADSARGNVGMGLAICKGMIEAHGGRIWAENLPAGGVAFRFTLPIEQLPPEPFPE